MSKTITDAEYKEFLILQEFKKQHDRLNFDFIRAGELVNQLAALAAGINGVGVKKKAPAPVKKEKLTREQRRQENLAMITGRRL